MKWKFWKQGSQGGSDGELNERSLRANDNEYNKQFKVAWNTTLFPFVIVLTFTAVKDAYDDIQRHASDRSVNNRKAFVVRDGRLEEEVWSNIKVGDIIRMTSNQFVAADLLLISTSEPHGIAYIETNELDGETNLKTKTALGETAWMADRMDSISRFKGPAGSIAVISTLKFFSYFILLNTLVPISLYVSVEILRFVHSLWINYDVQMYFENGENSVRAQARTTLNEELGQVQYIFSDKTGTLTRNVMTFNKASISGVSYGYLRDPRGKIIEINERTPLVDFSFNPHFEQSFKFYDRSLLEDTRSNLPAVREFWLIISLCHTVMPERNNGSLVYQAQSPDEAALTSAARNFGFVFCSRTPTSITMNDNGREVTYEVLCILDFNNDRKRMSVILRTPEGKIKLYCKGADTMVMARLSALTPSILRDSTNSQMDEFASIGLRTLCLAYKELSDEYFTDSQVQLKNTRQIFAEQKRLVESGNGERHIDIAYIHNDDFSLKEAEWRLIEEAPLPDPMTKKVALVINGEVDGFDGKTPFESAWVDALADLYKDYQSAMSPFIAVASGWAEGDKEALRKEVGEPEIQKFFAILEKRAKDNGSNGHFVGTSLTWIDLVVSDHVGLLNQWIPNVMHAFPLVQKIKMKTTSEPKLKEWIDKRPKGSAAYSPFPFRSATSIT